MTTKDKTGDQLMASIRKTKSEGMAPEVKEAGTARAATPAAAAPAVRKKVATKAKPAAARPRTTTNKAAAKPRATQAASGSTGASYQSSKRVWPD